jgi:hypothetical protein
MSAEPKRSPLANLKPFKPGQSGNPAGRKPLSHDIKTLCKQNTKKAFEKILELIDSDDERVALMAAKEIIDRAWGKAATADGASEDKRNVTINIVRYGEFDEKPKEFDGTAVQVRSFGGVPAVGFSETKN